MIAYDPDKRNRPDEGVVGPGGAGQGESVGTTRDRSESLPHEQPEVCPHERQVKQEPVLVVRFPQREQACEAVMFFGEATPFLEDSGFTSSRGFS